MIAPDNDGTTRVHMARADAARVTGIAADQWQVVSNDAVMWNNSALGLPRPGMAYLQVMSPGRKITLRHGDRDLVYHAGSTRVVFAGELMPDGSLWVQTGASDHRGGPNVWEVRRGFRLETEITAETAAEIRARLPRLGTQDHGLA